VADFLVHKNGLVFQMDSHKDNVFGLKNRKSAPSKGFNLKFEAAGCIESETEQD
jgi:hypothetical protein